ncbi:class I SAM-dependent methyltransferase [Listeria aquatica]|uniref:class I SAM-dependent methyltransferase n=1 Tax=Listeria aquatica TaxID=1494960 RepID=UPI0031F500D5
MSENIYDNPDFFNSYSQMERSKKGLEAAGEWHTLKEMLPDFTGKRVLDLGCGYGWHSVYAAEQGATSVTGVDISEKMLQVARAQTNLEAVEYLHEDIEKVRFEKDSFDIVISSLVFHYVEKFDELVKKVHHFLKANGTFIFSIEHPVLQQRVRKTLFTMKMEISFLFRSITILIQVKERFTFWVKI